MKRYLQKLRKLIKSLPSKAITKITRNPGYLNYKVWIIKRQDDFKCVPFRQVASLRNLDSIVSVLEFNNIPYWVAEGTLLGAVRQKAFAGRPGDIDIFVKLSDLDRLIEAVSKNNDVASWVFREEISALHVNYPIGCPVSFLLLTKDLNANIYFRKIYRKDKFEKLYREVSVSALLSGSKASIFGRLVSAPGDSELYLDRFYPGWRVPDKKQISWLD